MLEKTSTATLFLRAETRLATMMALAAVLGGCVSAPSPELLNRARVEAETCIERGMVYPFDPAIRAQSMEAAARVLGDAGRLRIREGLKDQHAGVRFAAAMTLGKLKDTGALPALRRLVNDPDASVRVGAYFAMEMMGMATTENRIEWRNLLRKQERPEIRRNAVMALGQLKDKSSIPILKQAASADADEGVRMQALEGLALLGEKEAVGRFTFEAFGGVGYKQPFALMTLGQVPDDRVIPTLRARLASAPYLEAQLAAARSLGAKGLPDGFDLALRSLDWNQPSRSLPEDRPENQIMRVHSMAAMALGEIGDPRAIAKLKKTMEKPEDPRIQLAAATAILMITNRMAEPPSVR